MKSMNTHEDWKTHNDRRNMLIGFRSNILRSNQCELRCRKRREDGERSREH